MTTIPSHSPLVWPSAIATPTGPAPGTASVGLSIGLNGAPSTGESTADFNAEGKVQKGYVLNPNGGKYCDSVIREGHLVFCHRGNNSTAGPKAYGAIGGADAMAHTIVPLDQINMIFEDAYVEAMDALQAQLDSTRGLPNQGLLKYLRTDEAAWSNLFVDDGKAIRSNRAFKHLYYLCRQGILTRWNYLGASILSSAPDSQSRGAMTYFPLNVCFKGVLKYTANIWGENAGETSQLFLILKRKYDPKTGQWGAFAFHPYASNVPVVPNSARVYRGIGGGEEFGTVIYVGIVRDSRRMTLPPEKLAIVQGLSPDSSPSASRDLSKQIPILDVALHKQICTSYECF